MKEILAFLVSGFLVMTLTSCTEEKNITINVENESVLNNKVDKALNIKR